MSAHVETEVLDPGTAPPYVSAQPDYECARSEGLVSWPRKHLWQLVQVEDDGTLWMCANCRRLERRRLVEDETRERRTDG